MSMLPGGNARPTYKGDQDAIWKEIRKLWKKISTPSSEEKPKDNIHEVVWSFAGDITITTLGAAGISPPWMPVGSGPYRSPGVIDPVAIRVVQVGWAWQYLELTVPSNCLQVSLFVGSNGIPKFNVGITTAQTGRVWLENQEITTSLPITILGGYAANFAGVVGSGLSYFMWYEYA